MPHNDADTSSRSEQVVDVIVAGAGIAGVSVAAQLGQAGLTVRVLEARERCGGRLHSVNIGGVTIDAGGQWIGPGQHRVLALARSLGLTLVPTWYPGKAPLCAGRSLH